MAGDESVESDYIDSLTGLSEPTNNLMFTTSETKLTIDETGLSQMGNSIAILVLVTCLLGFANGVDFMQPESGLIRPDEFVFRFANNAPDESAVFNGQVFDMNGEPIANATVYIGWNEGNYWNTSSTETDADGFFEIEKLDPGITRVDIIVDRGDYKDRYSNRVLLSPPAFFEPLGFTKIDFTIPDESEFAEQPCEDGTSDCAIRVIDNSPSQMDHPLMDSGASLVYTTFGVGFVSLSLISAGFAIWSLKTGSVALLRTSSILSIFTMGHYYSACLFGLVAFALTFAISKPQRELH
tara:strand:+ start:175 stop:1062 length:888 start_codon:yes stop_codon:yes gene_type:complete